MKIKQIKDDVAVIEIDFDTLVHIAALLGEEISEPNLRTIKQNSAMHKYFAILSSKLNEGGLSIAKTLKVDIEWTPTSVKDLLWRPIQEAVLDKKSTTKLNKDEITKVYDVLNKALGEKFGFSLEFPTRDLGE